MPGRPSHVEKVRNHNANPTGSPPSSAMSANIAGSGANSAECSIGSVAATSCGARSYAASSRTSVRIAGTSPGTAALIIRALARASGGLLVAALARSPAGGARLGLLRLPEDLRDLVDLVEQLLRDGGVERTLRAAGAGELGRVPEQLVQLRVLLEVVRLDVVRTKDPQVVLDEVRPLLLDHHSSGPERRVVVRLVLLADRLDRLGLDPRLRGVVDAARQVAVCRDGPPGGEHGRDEHGRKQTREQSHVASPSVGGVRSRVFGLGCWSVGRHYPRASGTRQRTVAVGSGRRHRVVDAAHRGAG